MNSRTLLGVGVIGVSALVGCGSNANGAWTGTSADTTSDAGVETDAAATTDAPLSQQADLAARLATANVPLAHYVGTDTNGQPCGVDLRQASLTNSFGLPQIIFSWTSSSGQPIGTMMSMAGFDSCSSAPTGLIDNGSVFQIVSLELEEGSTYDSVDLTLGTDATGAVTVTSFTTVSTTMYIVQSLACDALTVDLKVGKVSESCSNVTASNQ